MSIKQIWNRYFTWEWRSALMAAICLVPAVLLAAFGNEEAGIIGVMGILPAIIAGIRPRRVERAVILVHGLVWVGAVWLGHLIKITFNMPVTAALIAAIGAGMFLLSQKFSWGRIGFTMVVPVVCIGLNFVVPKVPLAFAQGMLPTSLLAYLVALCFPEFTPPPKPPTPPKPKKISWQFPALYAAALATGVGVAYNWDHTGWEVSAIAFSMRPSKQMEEIRSVSRMLAVIVGATLASLMLFANPPPVVPVLLAAALMVIGGGVQHSKANVMPAFMTFNIFTFMLFPAMDDTLVEKKYLERILWVALGLAIGCFYGLLLPRLWNRYMKWKNGRTPQHENISA